MQAITLRPETQADEHFLHQVYATSRAEEMLAVPWTDEQKSAFLAMQFALQRSHYRTHYPTADFLVILQADTPIGRLYQDKGDNNWLLMDIALLPEYQNQGIGSWLIKTMLTEAGALNKPVQLHVEQFNRAKNLYLKLGFNVIEDKGVHLLMEWRP